MAAGHDALYDMRERDWGDGHAAYSGICSNEQPNNVVADANPVSEGALRGGPWVASSEHRVLL